MNKQVDWQTRLKTFFTSRLDLMIGLMGITIFGLAWEWIGTSGIVNPLFTSAPSRIVLTAISMFQEGEIWYHMNISAQEFLIGFGLAGFTGIILGVVVGWYRFANALLNPFITLLYATPRVALIPLIIIWLGIGLWSKVAVVYLGAIFPIIVNTTSGFRTLDETLIKAARSFGANDWTLFWTIGLPGSVPFIISGLRLGLGRGLVAIVIAEMYASNAGIGYLIMIAGSSFQTTTVFVGVGIIAGAALLMDSALRMLERHFESWRV